MKEIRENIQMEMIIDGNEIEKRAMKIYKDKFKNNKEFTDLIIKLLDEYFSSEAIS